MPSAGDIPGAVQWYEGMLLAPQHFQQDSVRAEALRHYHLRLAAPFHWGVLRLDIDQGPLVGGLFRVRGLEAVMPDGLLVHHLSASERDLSIDIRPYTDQLVAAPMRIYLAVAGLRRGAASVVGELARYESFGDEGVVDLNTGEGKVDVPRLRPRLHLFIGETPPAAYSCFPIAEVRYEQEAFSLSPYVPPLLALPIESPLGEMCASVVKELREKADYLLKRAQSPVALAQPALTAEGERQVRELTAGLPQLEALLYTDVSHPFSVYVSLCTVVGHVAGVTGATLPPELGPYDHNDLRGSFTEVLDYITGVLHQVRQAYMVLRFGLEDDTFRLKLPEGITERALIVGVRTRPGVSEKETVDWLERSLIGSESRIKSMGARRVLGAARRRLEREDSLQLVPPPGVLLFAVKAEAEFVEPLETLVIVNPSEGDERTRPTQILLYLRAGTN
jgi:type VI secretion system protein ImpJ